MHKEKPNNKYMEEKKLKVGEEVFFLVSEKQMEKAQVESIDKKQGFAILSNRVKITRSKDKEGYYQRLDGKKGFAMPINEETEKGFRAIKAYFSLSRNLDSISKMVRDINIKDGTDILLELDKKITKLLNKYNQ